MPDYILPSRGGRVETGIIGIDEATAATHLLIPGLSGRRIAIMGLLLYANAAVTVTFGGHTSASSPPKLNDCGEFELAAKSGFVLPATADPACAYFVADAGDSVYMTLGGAVQVSGIIRYAYL